MTDLPKSWFRQTPKVDVTQRKISAVYRWRLRKIAHIGLSRKIISAGPLRRRDDHDISVFGRRPWRVTAELNEMVQYVQRDSCRQMPFRNFRYCHVRMLQKLNSAFSTPSFWEHLDCGKSGDQDGGSTRPLGHVPHKPKYRLFTKISVNRALQPIDYSDDHCDTSITTA